MSYPKLILGTYLSRIGFIAIFKMYLRGNTQCLEYSTTTTGILVILNVQSEVWQAQ
jgi:hypothetical protein